MGISYSAMVGVGCSYDDIELNSLTDEGREVFVDYAKDYNDVDENDESYDYNDYDVLQECWDDNSLKNEFLYGELNMVEIEGNAFTGITNTIGFDIELDLETLHQEVEKAKNKFKRYFNIEPELLLGVSVW